MEFLLKWGFYEDKIFEQFFKYADIFGIGVFWTAE